METNSRTTYVSENMFIKIGKGLVKLGKGIVTFVKETAWIQPLLIVGAIFALILNIGRVGSFFQDLFSPSTTSTFFLDNKTEMKQAHERAVAVNGDKVILIFYADSSSESTTNESLFNQVAINNDTDIPTNFYTIDCDDDATKQLDKDNPRSTRQDKIIDSFIEYFADEFDSQYNRDDLYKCLKSTSHATFEVGESGSSAIPTPMFARYENGECKGVKIGLSSSNSYDDFRNFCYGDVEKDWPSYGL